MTDKLSETVAAVFEMGIGLAQNEAQLRDFMASDKNAKAIKSVDEAGLQRLRGIYAARRDAFRRVNERRKA